MPGVCKRRSESFLRSVLSRRSHSISGGVTTSTTSSACGRLRRLTLRRAADFMSLRYIPIPAALRPDPGQRSLWRVEGRAIALFNVDGTLYAIDDGCPHSGASLVGGIVE